MGDVDPHKASATTGAGLAVGSIYYNRENNTHFTCTAAVNAANVWAGNYAGLGGTVTDYLSGSTYYRIHIFLSSGTFSITYTRSVDYLVVGGGGGGSNGGSNTGQGGGGAGGFRTEA